MMEPLHHRSLVAAARLHYVQPHRGYHNQEHLDELVVLAGVHTPDLTVAEQLALLFHDAVYVPGAGKGENERLSAELLLRTVAALARTDAIVASIDRTTLEQAGKIIEATTHAAPPSPEAARVCDLDLWRLAAPWADFQRHAQGIRFEYLDLAGGEEAFWTARRTFYKAMLAKPVLFSTAYFRDRFEAAARTNLSRGLTES